MWLFFFFLPILLRVNRKLLEGEECRISAVGGAMVQSGYPGFSYMSARSYGLGALRKSGAKPEVEEEEPEEEEEDEKEEEEGEEGEDGDDEDGEDGEEGEDQEEGEEGEEEEEAEEEEKKVKGEEKEKEKEKKSPTGRNSKS